MSPTRSTSLYPKYSGIWLAGDSRIEEYANFSSQLCKYNRRVMMNPKNNFLILFMIVVLICISTNLAFADQSELNSKVVFTVQ